jgi:hypothetical protein
MTPRIRRLLAPGVSELLASDGPSRGMPSFDGDLDGSDLAVYANVFGVPGNTPLFRVAGWFGHFRPQ